MAHPWLTRGSYPRGFLHLWLAYSVTPVSPTCRQYNRTDPENRLVSGQLEAKWNRCLEAVEAVRAKLVDLDEAIQPLTAQEREEIMTLSKDLPNLWNAETKIGEMKKKIIRTLIEEIIVDVDRERSQVIAVIHWVGGIHTRIEARKNKIGEHKNIAVESTIELVRQLAAQMADADIAALLNKMKLKTGTSRNWTLDILRRFRHRHQIPVYQEGARQDFLTLNQAAEQFGICAQAVWRLIQEKIISAKQIIPSAPWAIPTQELKKEKVQVEVKRVLTGSNRFKGGRPSSKQMTFIQ